MHPYSSFCGIQFLIFSSTTLSFFVYIYHDSCSHFSAQVNVNPPDWEGYTDTAKDTEEESSPKLSDFQNLILIKFFREEKVCICYGS